MRSTIDETHDVALRSWVTSANGHPDFPIQNLPLGIFSRDGGAKHAGIAVGAYILDLSALSGLGLLDAELAAGVGDGGVLNDFLAAGPPPRIALRRQVSDLLLEGHPDRSKTATALHEASGCTMHLPVAVGDYTDFYAGIHHAEAVGKLFRPDAPLPVNYKHLPIGYHGRASSIRACGVPVRRPSGQIKTPEAAAPILAATRKLDFELELGVWIGPGNAPGTSIDIASAHDHVAGFCLLNDWSARDVQSWEYQPLGPFLGKNFATTVSCWIVTPEALAPFRCPQAARIGREPPLLAYLEDATDQAEGAIDVDLEVAISTPTISSAGLAPQIIARSNGRHLCWTIAQMIAHHTVGGCDLRPGDLLGTGTISGPERDGGGSLLELGDDGARPILLGSGERRAYLEDGDEILLEARCRRDGFATIGFGECRATVQTGERG